jgi:hypothetical protein
VVTLRQPRGQGKELLHQLVAGLRIVAPAIAREQPPFPQPARETVVLGSAAAAVVPSGSRRANVFVCVEGPTSGSRSRARDGRSRVRSRGHVQRVFGPQWLGLRDVVRVRPWTRMNMVSSEQGIPAIGVAATRIAATWVAE